MGHGGDAGQGSFLVPCMLFMLERRPREVEELRELVAAFGFRQKAAELERPLQRLWDDRLIDRIGASGGDAAGSPRYALTAAGQQWLADRSQALADPARLVGRFLDRYLTIGASAAPWDTESTDAARMG